MYYIDSHVHTTFSTDGKSSPKAMIEQAISLGMKKICITDHNDIDFPPEEDGSIPFQLDLPAYLTKMRELKDRYASQIEVLIGVEQGLIASTDAPSRIDKYGIDCNANFDFVIGSSHMINNVDPYYEYFWENITNLEGIEQYLQTIVDNIRTCNNYDVYGHLDYIVRYVPDKSFVYDHKVHADIWEAILKSLIEKGKGIEINTAGLKYGLSYAHPCPYILTMYRDLGGEIVTIGSDGHATNHLAYDFNKVPAMLADAGFKYFTYFKDRKPNFVPVKDFI